MNKLREWFRRMAGVEARHIGFGASAPSLKGPSVGLLATLPSIGREVVAVALEAGAEGLVAPAGLASDADRLRAVMRDFPDCLWGLELGDGQAPESDQGFDFLLLSPSSGLSSLEAGDRGRLLVVDPAWDDTRLRAVDQVPLEGVVFTLLPAGEEKPRLEHLLALRRISMLMRKPLVVELRRPMSTKELEVLRDGGLSAIIVPGDTQKWVEAIKEFRQTIDALPAKAKTPREIAVMLPSLPGGRARETEEEEEEP
ncbi:MAG: hypothetical protein Q8R28_07585 [Dehalococcoidia bacterium]|nr:hypothetical protein [Dehalococcoidia bacterium]